MGQKHKRLTLKKDNIKSLNINDQSILKNWYISSIKVANTKINNGTHCWQKQEIDRLGVRINFFNLPGWKFGNVYLCLRWHTLRVRKYF